MIWEVMICIILLFNFDYSGNKGTIFHVVRDHTWINYHCIGENCLPSYCSNLMFNICAGILEKFKDHDKGGFKEALITDVQGMLGLYEAVHLRVHGEDILEEALAFSTIHLKAKVEHLEYPLAAHVAHALKWPMRKGLERLEARWYISVYQDEAFHDKTLLTLAKLDFNLVQSLHKEELSNLTRLVLKKNLLRWPLFFYGFLLKAICIQHTYFLIFMKKLFSQILYKNGKIDLFFLEKTKN